ncbi:MAG: Hpt domain-containing protein [Alphaproteobacteria bacterium]|nr:Hpt domain-containing protein [Alphaproteobacteria bacterium]
MINWDRVKELEEDIGIEEFGEVIDLFLDEVETVITPMRAGVQRPNIENDMHFLKGSALTIGFRQLGQICSDSEKLVASGRVSEVQISEILATFDASKAAFLAGLDQELG